MITWARRGGARKEVLERVTHNATGDIVDHYTHFDWFPLCEAILCLSYEGEDRVLGLRRGPIGRRGRELAAGGATVHALPLRTAERMPAGMPAISKVLKMNLKQWRRRESNSQESSAIAGDPRRSASADASESAPNSTGKHDSDAKIDARQQMAALLVELAAEGMRIQAEGRPDTSERLLALFERAHAAGLAVLARRS